MFYPLLFRVFLVFNIVLDLRTELMNVKCYFFIYLIIILLNSFKSIIINKLMFFFRICDVLGIVLAY